MATLDAKDLFVNNRQRLMEKLHGAVVVLSAHTRMQSSNDSAAFFEQEANFWWLCGVELPDWWLIIDGTRGKSWLVAPSRTKQHDDYDAVQVISGVDDVLSQDAGMSMLRDLAKRHSIVYALGEQSHGERLALTLNPAPRKIHDMLSRIFNGVQDCRKDIAALRAIKQPEEIARIKKAIHLTVEAFEQIKPTLASFKHEYEIEAEFTYHFRKKGASGHGYSPVVAGGINACVLDYSSNAAKLKKREFILIDVGARLQGYVADIARTYAYGEPTKRQAAVHAAVRQAQTRITALLKPNLAIEQYQREVDEVMQEALISLGLMTNKNDKVAYATYFPHAISHGLGVDSHDSLGKPRFFQPGMVLTVEPGLYIPKEAIGVRIEDNILITDTGHTNLSARLSTDL